MFALQSARTNLWLSRPPLSPVCSPLSCAGTVCMLELELGTRWKLALKKNTLFWSGLLPGFDCGVWTYKEVCQHNGGGSRIQHRDRNAQQKLELGKGHKARKQGISTVPETSASVPSCSLLTPSLTGERIGKGEAGVRVETHLWTFQRTFHPAGVATPRKYRCSLWRHHFCWQQFDRPVRFCSLCCAGAALCAVVLSNRPGNCFKKAAPSPPQLFLPWLNSQSQFTLSPLRCNWRKSAGVGKCSQKQANRGLPQPTVPLKKCPWPKTLGRISLQQSWPACLSEFERSKKRKGLLNPCRHVQPLHAVFLWKTWKEIWQ